MGEKENTHTHRVETVLNTQQPKNCAKCENVKNYRHAGHLFPQAKRRRAWPEPCTLYPVPNSDSFPFAPCPFRCPTLTIENCGLRLQLCHTRTLQHSLLNCSCCCSCCAQGKLAIEQHMTAERGERRGSYTS